MRNGASVPAACKNQIFLKDGDGVYWCGNTPNVWEKISTVSTGVQFAPALNNGGVFIRGAGHDPGIIDGSNVNLFINGDDASGPYNIAIRGIASTGTSFAYLYAHNANSRLAIGATNSDNSTYLNIDIDPGLNQVTIDSGDLDVFGNIAADGDLTLGGLSASLPLLTDSNKKLVSGSIPYANVSGTPTLATLATSGSASDLGTGTLPNARLSAVPNSALANSSITFTTASPLGGAGTYALGATVPLTCTGCLTSNAVSSVFSRTGAVVAAANDYTLSQINSPTASVSFTAPATNTYSLLGTAPASVSTAGTAAGTTFTLTSPAGGATTGSSTTGGTGGDYAITTGAGGSGAGGTNASGGRGGNFVAVLGVGGAKQGSGTVGVGGQFIVQQGTAAPCGNTASAYAFVLRRPDGSTVPFGISDNNGTPCISSFGSALLINPGNNQDVGFGANVFVLNTATGFVKTYKNIATVSNGVPSEYATIDLTAQSAAKTATTLYAATATGMFRACWAADITTAATTSSVLGGANGFQIVYTSPTDSVSKTTIASAADTSAANTTGTAVGGCKTMYVKTGTTIQYQFDYTSVGGTAMVYELHVKAEAL